MRVCILGIQNVKHMTLISLYTDFLKKRRIKFDLVYIDKYGIDEPVGADKTYKFDGTKRKYNSLLGKIIKTFDFKRYAKKILLNNNYDFVVVWREQTACIFADVLEKYYKGKYSVNIRDLWNKRNVLLTKMVTKAVNNSAFNTISSEGFIQHLPNAEYMMVHSSNKRIIAEGFTSGEINQLPIIITYLGTIRFEDYCVNLIKAFNNDTRFILKFIGQGSEALEDFCKKNNYTNVICEGSFEPNETNKKLNGTHIINCAFGAKEIAEQMLTPIRMYYAIYSNIPIMSAEGTWLDELGKKYEMSITVPANLEKVENLGEIVFNQYKHIDVDKMKLRQKELGEEVDASYSKFIEQLDSVFAKVEK